KRTIMRLPILTALVLATIGMSGTSAAAGPRLAKPEGETLLTRVADLDDPGVSARRRKARIYRYRRAYGYWRERPIVITSGHRLHRFRGEIEYTYLPGTCCRHGWR